MFPLISEIYVLFLIIGIILTVLFGAMILSYILKYLLFEAFYYVHVTVFFAVNIVAIIHGAIIIPICGLVWLLDLLLRYGITAKHVELKAALLPGNIIHIKFNKAFNYTPGQYIFLRISDVDPLQYHPFTIASAPHQEQTSLYLRPLGDWTGRLLKLINASVTSDSAVTSDGIEMGTVSAATDSNLTMPAYTILRAIVEGPYGITSVNFNDPEYQVVLLIAGGIGATPMLSIYHDLIQQARTGRSFRKVMLAWSVKDIAMIDSIDKSSCVGNSKIYSICRPPDFVSSLDGVDSKLMSESETINAESAFVTELYSSSLKGSARDQSIKDMPVKVGRPRIPGKQM